MLFGAKIFIFLKFPVRVMVFKPKKYISLSCLILFDLNSLSYVRITSLTFLLFSYVHYSLVHLFIFNLNNFVLGVTLIDNIGSYFISLMGTFLLSDD